MARPRQYTVQLSEAELSFAKRELKAASSDTRKRRYRILIAANKNPNLTYKEIGNKAGASEPTVLAALKSFANGGFEALSTIERNPKSDCARLKIDGAVEAKLIAKACQNPPAGAAKWTVKLLTEELIVLLQNESTDGVQTVSRSAVGKALQRNDLRPHLNEYWCIPPEEDANFVAAMEDVLDVYSRPYDERNPVWCMDEKPYQLLDEAREPIPMRPGDIAKIDSEYVRHGTVSIFCFIQPHTGTIVHAVEQTRTAVDWAEKIRYLVDEVAPNADKITLVMDNLNTHCLGSLYKAFPPEEARRIARKLDIHYTPKHGSWLDIAELGINIITRECLDRRIPSIEQLQAELKAWNIRYDQNKRPVNWQFTTEDARIKLKSLYPDIQSAYASRDNRRKMKDSSAAVSEDSPKAPNAKV